MIPRTDAKISIFPILASLLLVNRYLQNYLYRFVRGHFQTIFKKLTSLCCWGGEGVRGHGANFSLNFEPSFLIVGLELVSTCSCTMSVQTTLACISATVFKSRYDYQLTFAMTLRGDGGGVQDS